MPMGSESLPLVVHSFFPFSDKLKLFHVLGSSFVPGLSTQFVPLLCFSYLLEIVVEPDFQHRFVWICWCWIKSELSLSVLTFIGLLAFIWSLFYWNLDGIKDLSGLYCVFLVCLKLARKFKIWEVVGEHRLRETNRYPFAEKSGWKKKCFFFTVYALVTLVLVFVKCFTFIFCLLTKGMQNDK